MDIVTLILIMPLILVVEAAVLGYVWTHPRGPVAGKPSAAS
jgi:hypothetical protein